MAVNRAVAIGHAVGAASGLDALNAVQDDPAAQIYASFHAARAYLLDEAGDYGAPEAWARAAELTRNGPQRDQLLKRSERSSQPAAEPRS